MDVIIQNLAVTLLSVFFKSVCEFIFLHRMTIKCFVVQSFHLQALKVSTALTKLLFEIIIVKGPVMHGQPCALLQTKLLC